MTKSQGLPRAFVVVGRDSKGAVRGGQNLSVGIHYGSLFAMVRRRIDDGAGSETALSAGV